MDPGQPVQILVRWQPAGGNQFLLAFSICAWPDRSNTLLIATGESMPSFEWRSLCLRFDGSKLKKPKRSSLLLLCDVRIYKTTVIGKDILKTHFLFQFTHHIYQLKIRYIDTLTHLLFIYTYLRLNSTGAQNGNYAVPSASSLLAFMTLFKYQVMSIFRHFHNTKTQLTFWWQLLHPERTCYLF